MSENQPKEKTLEDYAPQDIEKLVMDALMTMPEPVLDGYDVVAVLIRKSDSVTSLVYTVEDQEKTREIIRHLYEKFYSRQPRVTVRQDTRS